MRQALEMGTVVQERYRHVRHVIFLLVLVCLAGINVAYGQGAKGGITGSLLDPSGASVVGASVTETNLDTGTTRSTVSKSDGVFLFALVDPGRYRVEVVAQGFKKLVRQPVVVLVTETASLGQVALAVGEVTETVTVSNQTELLQTESATTGNVFDSQLVAALPLVTRNFTQLLTLQAGVVSDVPVAAAFGNGTQGFSVAGARYYDNSIMLNGSSAVSAVTGGSYNIAVPSPDTVEEFKVQSSLYSAEYGQSGGSSVNLVTKSGTNKFHGNLFEFFRNDALNANEYFYKASQIQAGNGNKAPILRQNQFGGTIGGPIRRNKTFFFFGYQGTRQINGAAPGFVYTLPSYPLLPQGDRSNTGNLRTALGAIYGGRVGFPTGICALNINCVLPDGSNINPVAINILQAKLPNGKYLFPSFPQSALNDGQGGAGGGQVYSNASFSLPGHYNEDQYVLDLDHQISNRQLLSGKFFTANIKTNSLLGNLPGFSSVSKNQNRNFTLSYTLTASPTLVNELRASFLRVALVTNGSDPISASDVGIKPAPDGGSYFPWFLISQAGISASSLSNYAANSENQYTIGDTVSKVIGKHSLRFGGSFTRHRLPQDQDSGKPGGVLMYSFADFLIGQDAAGNGLASLGLPYSNLLDTAAATGSYEKSYRFNDMSYFAQDDIKLTKNLTLNLGLRWDYFEWPHDIYGRMGAFDPSLIAEGRFGIPTLAQGYTGFILARDYQRLNPTRPIPAGVALVNNTLVNGTDLKNFGPRVGFAWQPLTHWSVRGGYGLFYPRSSTAAADNEATGIPFNNIEQLSFQANGTLQDPFSFINLPPDSAFPLWQPRQDVPGAATAGYYNQVLDPNARNPYVQQFNLSVERELGKNSLLEIAYLGSHGLRLLNTLAGNQPGIASPSNPIRGITTNTTLNIQDRVPVAGVLADRGLALDLFNGSSKYNALLLTFNQRLSHGLQFLSSFTFGKSADNNSLNSGGPAGGTSGLSGGAGNAQPPGDNNLNNHWGLSAWDRKTRSTTSLVYQLPDPLKNRPGILDKLVGGWQTAAIMTFQSGLPITFGVSTAHSAVKLQGYLTPNLAPGATLADIQGSGPNKKRLTNYFKSAGLTPGTDTPLPGSSFVLPGPLDYGQLGRGLPIRTPGQKDVDFSLIKQTPIHEQIHLEFRVEFFNLFNWVNFGAPNATVDSTTYGYISSTTVSPRIIQFGLKLAF
jgi:outer membrane receptor protein involved in Fe transport